MGGKQDPYKVLGVDRNASAADIKKAYRGQAMKWHPDRHSEANRKTAEKKFSDAANAYDILSDPQKKAQYDAGGFPGMGMGMGGSPRPGGFQGFPGHVHSQEAAEQMFRQVFGQGAMEDIMSQLLGRQPPGRQQEQQGMLRVGSRVQVDSNLKTVLQACRLCGIDQTHDRRRQLCLGKDGVIVKVDTSDQTVKVRVRGVGDAWFGAQAVRPVTGTASQHPQHFSPFQGFGGMSGFGSFGDLRSGPQGKQVMREYQQIVQHPDGRRTIQVRRIIRGRDGSTREEVTETPLN